MVRRSTREGIGGVSVSVRPKENTDRIAVPHRRWTWPSVSVESAPSVTARALKLRAGANFLVTFPELDAPGFGRIQAHTVRLRGSPRLRLHSVPCATSPRLRAASTTCGAAHARASVLIDTTELR